MHHFPIALHPQYPDDSEQVLARSTNRPIRRARPIDFGEAAPFTRRSGTRRNNAPGYSWPPLLYQDNFRIPRTATVPVCACGAGLQLAVELYSAPPARDHNLATEAVMLQQSRRPSRDPKTSHTAPPNKKIHASTLTVIATRISDPPS